MAPKIEEPELKKSTHGKNEIFRDPDVMEFGMIPTVGAVSDRAFVRTALRSVLYVKSAVIDRAYSSISFCFPRIVIRISESTLRKHREKHAGVPCCRNGRAPHLFR